MTVNPLNESGDDGASLIMAVMIMMVLTTLSLAVLGRTLSVMDYAKHGQDYDAALATADAGLSDALYQIDQTTPDSFSRPDEPGVGIQSGAGKYKYWALKISDRRYDIYSVGQVGDARHGIQARITRSAQYPYALFSDQRLDFNGTTALGAKINFYSFNRLAGDPDEVRIGSNNTVICRGTPDPNIYIDWAFTQSECESTRLTHIEPRVLTIQEPPPDTVDPPKDNQQPCPTDGVFGVPAGIPVGFDVSDPVASALATAVYVDGLGGVPFVCRQDVTLRGLVVPTNGPVKIYILPSIAADGTKTYHSLDMASAVVNPTLSATQMQIFKTGDVPMTFAGNTSNNLTFRGVLFAPETRITFNGGVWWAGSITAGQLIFNGAPNLKIGYDYDLGAYLGPDWRVVRYREIPSNEAPSSLPATSTTSTSTTTTSTTLIPELPSTSTSTTSTSTTSTTLLPPILP